MEKTKKVYFKTGDELNQHFWGTGTDLVEPLVLHYNYIGVQVVMVGAYSLTPNRESEIGSPTPIRSVDQAGKFTTVLRQK